MIKGKILGIRKVKNKTLSGGNRGRVVLWGFLGAPCGLWDLSFSTRDGTHVLGSASVES